MKKCSFLALRMKQKQRSTTLNHFPYILLKQGRDSLSSSLLTERCQGPSSPLNPGNLWGDTLFTFRPRHMVLFCSLQLFNSWPASHPLPCSTPLFSHSLTEKGFKKFQKGFPDFIPVYYSSHMAVIKCFLCPYAWGQGNIHVRMLM